MSRKIFTEEQQQLLRQNPYIYSVTDTRINLTKEFKEIFLAEYKSGTSPRKILEDHGFDISIIGERRIWSISNHIRTEYKKYGEFHEGYYNIPITVDTRISVVPTFRTPSPFVSLFINTPLSNTFFLDTLFQM